MRKEISFQLILDQWILLARSSTSDLKKLEVLFSFDSEKVSKFDGRSKQLQWMNKTDSLTEKDSLLNINWRGVIAMLADWRAERIPRTAMKTAHTSAIHVHFFTFNTQVIENSMLPRDFIQLLSTQGTQPWYMQHEKRFQKVVLYLWQSYTLRAWLLYTKRMEDVFPQRLNRAVLCYLKIDRSILFCSMMILSVNFFPFFLEVFSIQYVYSMYSMYTV